MTDQAPTRRGQPPGLFLLFLVEMWERFSFYGMRAILVLFIADSARGGMGWSAASASRLFGWYGFAAYALPVLGGVVADRWWGTHRSIVVGGAIIAAGHFCMAIPSTPTFFLGMALVAIGTGFFKVNASTMVGQLYGRARPAPRRRLHHLLHGRERRRAAGAAGLRLPGREPALGLALRLRLRGRRDAVRPGAVRASQAALPGRHRRPAQPRPRGRDARDGTSHARRSATA